MQCVATCCIQVLQKSAKQRRDSIESYKAGGRQDLVDKEAAEVGGWARMATG
jgi:hypothetical protein